MHLRDLFAGLGVSAPDTTVSGITSNSRHVNTGDLFLACAGQSAHGLDYLDAILAAGATAIAWEPVEGRAAPAFPEGVVGIEVAGLSRQLGHLGDRFFGRPSSQLSMTGITGTNGKTTTAWLVAEAMHQSGRSSAYMGTLGYGVIPDLRPSNLTTPGCIEMHRRLRELADRGVKNVIMEVSSHALDQRRIDGVRLDTAALTNFSRDHLDYHGSLEAYAAAKARLFLEYDAGNVVVNVGDAFGRELVDRLAGRSDSITVALVEPGETPSGVRLVGHLTAARRSGLGLRLTGDFGDAELQSPLWGRFNGENLVVAVGIMLASGFQLDEATDALARIEAPPGRMQQLRAAAGQPAVVIDFAHTPDALENALQAARAHSTGYLWCVFGCGGDRDRGKRAPMAAVAERCADRIIVTDDNPRQEDPARIVADILTGFSDSASFEVLHDRGQAIDTAIRTAAPGDTVLIAGKGHESRQLLAGGERSFSDVDAARSALGRVE